MAAATGPRPSALLRSPRRSARSPSAVYLFPESPLPDDSEFVAILDREDVLVLPGRMFETPGFFRISLTATMATIEASLPRFQAAFATATESAAAH